MKCNAYKVEERAMIRKHTCNGEKTCLLFCAESEAYCYDFFLRMFADTSGGI